MTTPSSTLAIILAGGKGSRMDVLTQRRAKPTLPFGGVHSLLDICLSNLANSGLTDVWVVVQYHASSLDGVLAHGRPWDLDRGRGGLRVIPPQQGTNSDEDGLATGNADALFRMRELVREHDPELVLVLSADHCYRLDLREVIAGHVERGAECTVVTTTIPQAEAGHHMVVDVDEAGRVRGVSHKPDEPAHSTIASEVFCYSADVLLEALDELYERLSSEAPEGDTGLGDFSEHLLPALVERGHVYAHDLGGYWRDLGRPSAYLRAHFDLLEGRVDVLGQPDWPIRTAAQHGAAAHLVEGATVVDSMVGDGSRVEGEVRHSVVGADVVVEAGAVVHDSVLMRGARVRSGAHVGWAILDQRVEVGEGASVGERGEPNGDDRLRSEEVTLVGMAAVIAAGATVEPGGHVDAGGTVR